MKQYLARPSIYNRKGERVFDNPKDACDYLNELLAPKEGDEEYVFPTMSTKQNKLSSTMKQYIDIGKLIIKEAS